MHKKKLKVLQIVTRLDVGGVPEHILTLVEGLIIEGFDVSVACNHVSDPIRQKLESLGINIHLIELRRLIHPADIISAWRLYKFLRKSQFDIVHTHMSKAALLGGLMARAAHVPVIVNTAHNLGCIAFTSRWLRTLFWIYDKLLFGITMDAVILVSKTIQQQVTVNKLLPKNKAKYIANGINPQPFITSDPKKNSALKKSLSISETDLIIGTIARLVWFKGLHVLIAAFSVIRRNHPNARLLIIGEGPLKQELEQQARQLNVYELITFLGERNDVADLLPIFDLFVLPSVSEGMPITILEAMAAGKPIIASKVGGIPEIVLDGESGILVPSEDSEALATAVTKLLNDHHLRNRMGLIGKERVMNEFGTQQMIKNTALLYNRLLLV